jgi:hypothetical protein
MLEFVLGHTMGRQPATPPPSAVVDGGASPINRIEDLDGQLHELALIVSAILSLLERHGVTSEQLIAKLEEFERADGSAGGAGRSWLLECPSCHSKVGFGLQNCQFCGTKVRTETGQPLDQT